MARKGARVVFNGRVQGVWFRANTRKKALDHCLSGWVRNQDDGSVEALFEGEEDDITRLLDEMERGAGMGAASIVEKDVSWVKPGGLASFDILRDD